VPEEYFINQVKKATMILHRELNENVIAILKIHPFLCYTTFGPLQLFQS